MNKRQPGDNDAEKWYSKVGKHSVTGEEQRTSTSRIVANASKDV